ncbi:proton pump-interactor 1-like [Brassica napus]|nr:proton pump-interactor 1-like [Brassica napus]
MIYSYEYRIQHESIPLTEEKQLLKEIRLLEGTRDKVIANEAMRSKNKEAMGHKDDIQGQVKLMGAGLDGVKKEAEKEEIEAPVEEKPKKEKKVLKEKPIRNRIRNRGGPETLPRPMLKRKKQTNYMVWAAPAAAAVVVLMLLVLGYYYVL